MKKEELNRWLYDRAVNCRKQIIWLKEKQKLTPKIENKIRFGVRKTESHKRLLLILDVLRRSEEN
jgi:hypothetical protein